VLLREPVPQDAGVLLDVLSVGDAVRFGLEQPLSEDAVKDLIERAAETRKTGASFTYAITTSPAHPVVGLIQVRQLDPTFETAEAECVLAPSARGTGAFIETARLAGSFAFDTVGVHRIESRVETQNGRANGALRKLGAVQEGILRRALRRGDEHIDQVLWAVLREDWGERWVSTAPRVH
jgi:RimJ/RimL family protein N-acetyltransferase